MKACTNGDENDPTRFAEKVVTNDEVSNSIEDKEVDLNVSASNDSKNLDKTT